MRKFLFGIFIFIGFIGHAQAEPKLKTQPYFESLVSEAGYISSNTAGVSTSVEVSSVPAKFHAIIVGSSGGAGAKCEIWDARLSTTTAIRKITTVDTSASRALPFNVDCSSGLLIFNQGTNQQGANPADVTIVYEQR